MRVRRAAVFAAFLAIFAAAPAHAARPRWDTQLLALVPAPGFPAMAYVAPNGRIYEGTYDNPLGTTMPSRVLEYAADGTLLRSWTLFGQSLNGQGVQVGTSDNRGRLVLLDKSPPRVLLLDPGTGTQTTLATFPDTATPNYAAWGPDGALYVTDYTEPTIWRIPAGGGVPTVWLQDPQLNGNPFGTTGIALTADHRSFVIGVQSEAGLSAGNPTTGRLLTVPIGADGKPGAVRQLWESRPADGPDGFAIAQSGAIYVALLVANQIAVIGPDGTERERFPTSPYGGDNGSSVPFDAPSSVRFLGNEAVIANQSYITGNTAHQAILDVALGEPGLTEYIPPAPVSTAALAPAKPNAKRTRNRRGRRRHARHSRGSHSRR